jgi:acetyltransferase
VERHAELAALDHPRDDVMNALVAPLAPVPRFPVSLIDRLWLNDGRSVVVRPVLPQDADAEQRFVRALSPASRARRFHFGVRELAPGLLRSLTQIDHDRHVAVVAQADGEEDTPVIVADARYVRQDDGDEAEFAIAVADEWQGSGLGHQLLERLIRHARRHGVRRLVGDVLQDNQRMMELVRKSGGRMVHHPGDATLAQAAFEL